MQTLENIKLLWHLHIKYSEKCVWFDSLYPSTIFQFNRDGSLNVSCSRTTTQWHRWGSNPQHLSLESSTLPLPLPYSEKHSQIVLALIYYWYPFPMLSESKIIYLLFFIYSEDSEIWPSANNMWIYSRNNAKDLLYRISNSHANFLNSFAKIIPASTWVFCTYLQSLRLICTYGQSCQSLCCSYT